MTENNTETNNVAQEWQNFMQQTEFFDKEMPKPAPKSSENASAYEPFITEEFAQVKLEKKVSLEIQQEQLGALKSQLQQMTDLLKQERLDKKQLKTILLEKSAIIENLELQNQANLQKFQSYQEQLNIERNNCLTAQSDLNNIVAKLHNMEKVLQQREHVIRTLKHNHDEAMRRTQLLIQEFYQEKFGAGASVG